MKVKVFIHSVPALVFSAAFLFLIWPAAIQAQFSFTTNSDGSLNVSGYTGSGGVVVIPDTTNSLKVTSIGNNAFSDCTSLTSIIISTNVSTIGDDVFFYCTNLTNATIPDSVTSIGDQLFAECTSLTNIIIPPDIGLRPFPYDCTNLSTVTIGDGSFDREADGGVISYGEV